MYEVEVFYRRDGRGGIEFIADRDADEFHDKSCELRVRFAVTAIYPPEPDVGAGMDWNGEISTIHMRALEIPRMCRLRDDAFVAAKAFLLAEHSVALWRAGDAYAETLHFGKVA